MLSVDGDNRQRVDCVVSKAMETRRDSGVVLREGSGSVRDD